MRRRSAVVLAALAVAAVAGCGGEEEAEPTSTIGAQAREVVVAGTAFTEELLEQFVPGGVRPGLSSMGCTTLAPDGALIADLEAAVTEANGEQVRDITVTPRGVLAGRCGGTLYVLVSYEGIARESGNATIAVSEFVKEGTDAFEEPTAGPDIACGVPPALTRLWRINTVYCTVSPDGDAVPPG